MNEASYIDFYNQACNDRDAMKILYQSKNYGNSAYHAQQAIEKLIKAMILRDDSKFNIKHLSHVILNKRMLNAMKNKITKEFKNDAYFLNELKPASDCGFDYMKTITEYINDNKVKWWKYTMLNADASECGEFEKSIYQFIAWELILTLPVMVENAPYEKQLSDKMDNFLINKSYYIENIDDSQSTEKIKWMCDRIIDNFYSDHNSLQWRTIYTTLCLAVLSIKLYPHEEIGRYPQQIDGKSSLQLYEENSDRLLELQNSVDEVFKNIEFE